MINNNILNFLKNNQFLINIKINKVLNIDFNNFSFDKYNYIFNN